MEILPAVDLQEKQKRRLNLFVRFVELNTPTIVWVVWGHFLMYGCMYYTGNMFYPANSLTLLIMLILFTTVLSWACILTVASYFFQIFRLLYKKNYNRVIQNIVAIVLFVVTLIFIKPYPFHIPFALGLKNCYAKHIHVDRFQQWIESDEIEQKIKKGIILIDKYDDPCIPVVLQEEVKMLSPMQIEIGILPSGSKYLRLKSDEGIIGAFGFVTGVNKEEFPYEKYPAPEYRTEIDKTSFVWIWHRWQRF